jgi:hypothetical protein
VNVKLEESQVETPETQQTAESIVDSGEGVGPFAEPETPAEPTQAPAEGGEQQAAAPPEEGTPEWAAQITGRLDELRSDLGLHALPPQQQPEQVQERQDPADALSQLFPASPEAQPDPNDPDSQIFDDPYGEPEDVRAQLQEYLQDEIQKGVRAAVDPFLEQQLREKRVEAAVALEQEFPELARPEVATPVVQMGHSLLAEMGMPQAANHPGFAKVVRLIYMASKAGAAASSETPAGQSNGEVSLETGGARAPQSQQQQPDEGDLIVQAGQGAKLGFMT